MDIPASVAVMNKEVRRAAKMRRQEQHDEKVRQVKKILNDAGYNCGWGMSCRRADIDFFLGSGSEVVVAVCNHKDPHGVDILIQLSLSSGTDGLDALRKVLTPREPHPKPCPRLWSNHVRRSTQPSYFLDEKEVLLSLRGNGRKRALPLLQHRRRIAVSRGKGNLYAR